MRIKLLSYQQELYRKLAHCLSLFIPITYYYFNFQITISILIVSTLITLTLNIFYKQLTTKINFLNNLLSPLLRIYEYKSLWGASYMLIAFTLITTIFEKNIVIISMLISSISDSLAAIVGIKYGTVRFQSNKSIEGFYAFFISSYIILYFTLDQSNIYLLTIALLIAFAEFKTSTKYDNLTIPLLCSLCLYTINI